MHRIVPTEKALRARSLIANPAALLMKLKEPEVNLLVPSLRGYPPGVPHPPIRTRVIRIRARSMRATARMTNDCTAVP